jgi:rhodanese-related sulfurtransferase
MSFLRKLLGLAPKVDCHELIANGAILIDVRTPAEYSGGKPKNSQNIPLDKIDGKIEKIKKLKKPIILCCASGMRSGRATSILKSNGIEAYNGGGWNKFA